MLYLGDLVALFISAISWPLVGLILILAISSMFFFTSPPATKPGPEEVEETAFDTLGFSTTQSPGEGETDAEGAEAYRRSRERDDSMDFIFANNRKWREKTLARDPNTFKRFATSQSPKYLYIGCSDSRVPAQSIMGLGVGELFVVRNVANLCVNTDHSLLAALAYAVKVLEVTDIIVCGHYGCGGVRAAMENKDHGLLEHWLLNIRNVQRLHLDELEAIEDVNERHRRYVELNVQESCINLFANPVVQKKQALNSLPRIHGFVYDVATGFLKKLDIDFKAQIRKFQSVYRLHDVPVKSSPKVEVGSLTPRRKEFIAALANLPQRSFSLTPRGSTQNFWGGN